MMKYLVGVLLALTVNTAFAVGPLMQRYQQVQQQNQNQSVDSTVIYDTGSTAVVVPNGQAGHGAAYGHRGAYGAGHRNVNGTQHRGNNGHKTSGKRERR